MAQLQQGDQNGGGHTSAHQESNEPSWGGHNRGFYLATRYSKVDFLCFDGSDINGWVFRCQHFFEVDQTPAEMKVKLAIINLEGMALQ